MYHGDRHKLVNARDGSTTSARHCCHTANRRVIVLLHFCWMVTQYQQHNIATKYVIRKKREVNIDSSEVRLAPLSWAGGLGVYGAQSIVIVSS